MRLTRVAIGRKRDFQKSNWQSREIVAAEILHKTKGAAIAVYQLVTHFGILSVTDHRE